MCGPISSHCRPRKGAGQGGAHGYGDDRHGGASYGDRGYGAVAGAEQRDAGGGGGGGAAGGVHGGGRGYGHGGGAGFELHAHEAPRHGRHGRSRNEL